MSDSCFTCKHWHRLEDASEHGECRIHPPAHIQWVSGVEELARTIPLAVWPTTGADDHCGQWTGSDNVKPPPLAP